MLEEDTYPQFWTIGATERSDSLVVTSSLDGAAGYVCSRATSDKTNLVIDVLVCSRGVTDEAEEILHGIASRLPV